MKHIVRKAYWDYEKEENWLNEMSAKGLALTDYSWCRYVFTETPENEYTYRIELLNNLPSHPESRAYIRFLEENGVEFVASYMRWIYLRKKTSVGPFEIYSDKDLKIKHYRRVLLFWNTLMAVEFLAALSNLIRVLIQYLDNGTFLIIEFIFGFLLTLIGISFFRLGSRLRKKVKILNEEKKIRE